MSQQLLVQNLSFPRTPSTSLGPWHRGKIVHFVLFWHLCCSFLSLCYSSFHSCLCSPQLLPADATKFPSCFFCSRGKAGSPWCPSSVICLSRLTFAAYCPILIKTNNANLILNENRRSPAPPCCLLAAQNPPGSSGLLLSWGKSSSSQSQAPGNPCNNFRWNPNSRWIPIPDRLSPLNPP